MAQYHAHDEGLRNLRRRAPMMAMWDDHETTNVSLALIKTNKMRHGAYSHGTYSTELLWTRNFRDHGSGEPPTGLSRQFYGN
jgi:phosphodiesterase/alkaline phosphatase D-like protein